MKKHEGSCLCGQVKFNIEGEFESFYLCHCQYCQKDTGSAHAANLFSTKAALHWLSGKESIKTFNLPSTRHIKSFCTLCGSAIPNLQEDGRLLVAPAGSLNTSIEIKPTAHLFCTSKATWDQDLDEVPKYKTFPE